MKNKLIATSLAAAGLLVGAGLSAQAQITNVFTFSLTVQYASDRVTDSGTVTTYGSPGSKKIATKDLLSILAQDEYAAGNYDHTNFPTGSKLVMVDESFWVLDKTNNFICDVSDILFVEGDSERILSGKQSDDYYDYDGDPFPASSYTTLNQVYLSFDDTFIFGGNDLQFFITGLDKSVTSATTPNTMTGAYTETKTHTISGGVGSGSFEGDYFVITGSVTTTGKGSFTL